VAPIAALSSTVRGVEFFVDFSVDFGLFGAISIVAAADFL
jgi:hypothetical protein